MMKEEFVFFYALTHCTGKEGVKELLFSSCNVAAFILGDCRFCTPGTTVWILSLSFGWINMRYGFTHCSCPQNIVSGNCKGQ